MTRRIEIGAAGCWLWTRSCNSKGYGYAWWNGRHWRAHRLAYEAFRGRIPEGAVVHHICGVRRCVNPDHLEPRSWRRETQLHRLRTQPRKAARACPVNPRQSSRSWLRRHRPRVLPPCLEVVIRFRLLIAAAFAALTFTPLSSGASPRQLHTREHRQIRSLHRRVGTVRFFRSHLRLARTAAGRRALRVAHVWLPIIRRELAETRAQLRPRWSYPAWWAGHPSSGSSRATGAYCIHEHESIDWRWSPSHHPGQSTWNGYYNGFQFVLRTWQATFAPGEPHGLTYFHPDAASEGEQLHRAYVNWLRNGSRFGGGQWPNSSRACGLR